MDNPTHMDSKTTPENEASATGRRGWFRWVICAVLFFATTINYIDRQIIGILKQTLEAQLGWSEKDYAQIVFSFQAAYAIGYLVGGRMMDWIGLRLGYALAVGLWSVAAVAHGWMRSVTGFCAVRAGLGLAEGGNFPAAIKTVAEWFPRQERALATGIFNAGSNVGALVTPILVPWLTLRFGWPAAFWVTGSLGFFWLCSWVWLYRHPATHPRLGQAELAHIQSDPPDPAVRVSWLALLACRPTWAFLLANFLVSPVWWFYLFWIPSFLNKQYHLNLQDLGAPLVAIYLFADVGSIGGGWLSSHWLKGGWSVNAARKTALLVCALCVVPIYTASSVSQLWLAVGLIGLAAAAHQGFSANLYTVVSDTVPRQYVSSVVGIGGMAGAIGGMIFAKIAGHVLQEGQLSQSLYVIASAAGMAGGGGLAAGAGGSLFCLPAQALVLQQGHAYQPLFVMASLAYLMALGLVHLLLPKMRPMQPVAHA